MIHFLVCIYINIPWNFSEMADLAPDHLELARSAHLEDKQLFYLQCAIEENCLASTAYKQMVTNSLFK